MNYLPYWYWFTNTQLDRTELFTELKKMLLITYYSILVVILWERANTCSIKLAVSRTLKYLVWFISYLNKMVFILLIFPHTKASSFSSPGCRIFFCLLFYHRELPRKCNIHRVGVPSFLRRAFQSLENYLPSVCFLTTFLGLSRAHPSRNSVQSQSSHAKAGKR